MFGVKGCWYGCRCKFEVEFSIFEKKVGLYFWVLLKVFGVISVWCNRLLVRLPRVHGGAENNLGV